MAYSKEDLKQHYILMCRYYDGTSFDMYKKKHADTIMSEGDTHSTMENELPTPANIFFGYEEHWVNERINGYDDYGRTQEYIAYGHEDFDKNDGTPISLKALLWNKYYHWGGWMPDQESFRIWYRENYSCEPTNQEKRAAKRKILLIKKCIYYKGEKVNPWEVTPFIEFNEQRKRFWELEKQWVKALSISYNSPLGSRKIITKLGLSKSMTKKQIPISLANHIIASFLISKDKQKIDKQTAKEFIENQYLKSSPSDLL